MGPGRLWSPEVPVPESRPAAAATARALVRPLVARNALTAAAHAGRLAVPRSTPGPTAVVLGHRAPDGTLRVGCVDSEDGAEALVRASDEDAMTAPRVTVLWLLGLWPSPGSRWPARRSAS